MNTAVQGVDTISGLLAAARVALVASESAGLDAELLLCGVLGVSRTHIYAHPQASVPRAEAADFTRLVARRAEGYPLAYLRGAREFWSMDLAVNEHTLIPRPETELLVEAVLPALALRERPVALDLGTGTGAVAIALAREHPAATVVAADVCRHALDVATANARALDVGNITFLRSDWFSALGRMRFDVMTSNPPYVDECDPALGSPPLCFEPRLALDGGPGGLSALTRIIAGAGRHLLPGGLVALEHGSAQGGSVRELLRAAGFVDVRTITDLAGHERVTMGTWT